MLSLLGVKGLIVKGSHSNNFIPGSFYLLFFILSAANVILVTSSSVN